MRRSLVKIVSKSVAKMLSNYDKSSHICSMRKKVVTYTRVTPSLSHLPLSFNCMQNEVTSQRHSLSMFLKKPRPILPEGFN